MPENWLLPQLTSNYATGVLQVINNKFIDCITLFRGGDGSNLPVNAIRYNGDLNGTFQRWNGTLWNNMILGIEGGGTGSDNPSGIRNNLGLGTMAMQNSNAVAITGGTAAFSTVSSTGMGWFGSVHTPDGANIYGIDAAKIATGVINPARLANGAPNNTVFLRGDSTWAAPAGTLPSGLIAMFSTSCPAGWTRFAALDGRYPRGNTVYGGVGGQYSHSHTAGSLAGSAHTHGAGSYSAASHNHGNVSINASGNTSASGAHEHTVFGSVSGTTGTENNGSMNVDAGGSGTMSRSSHGHSFNANVVGAGTNNTGGHTHTWGGTYSGGTANSGSLGVSGTSASAGGGAISGSTDVTDHQPPFIDMVFCQKD